MIRPRYTLAVLALALLCIPSAAFASDTTYSWTPITSLGSHSWTGVTVSADGTKMAASYGNATIKTSTDSGANWSSSAGSGSNNWEALGGSADGSFLIGATYNGNTVTTSNGGANWTVQGGSGSHIWEHMAVSGDGSVLVTDTYNGYVYTSTDGGATWTARTSLGTAYNWSSIGINSTGSSIVLGAFTGTPLEKSTDGGATWTALTNSGNHYWYAVSMSSDGMKIIASYDGGVVYSSDGGSTWTTVRGIGRYGSAAISGDGSIIAVAITNPGTIYTSSDGGSTWTTQTSAGSQYWDDMKLSSNGHVFLASVSSGANAYLYLGRAAATPSVSLTAPTTSEATSSTMTLAASATPSFGATVSGVTFYVDGVAQGAKDTTAPYSISYDTTATSTGTHTAFAVVTDSTGASATSTAVSFTVDNVAPTVSVTAPTARQTVGGTYTLTASASDADTSVAGVSFWVNGTKIGSTDTSAPYRVSWDTTSTSTGSGYSVVAVARDAAGNYATSSPVSFSVSNAPPAFSAVTPTGVSNGATISWTTAGIASTKVAFGLDTSYSSTTRETNTGTRVTSHSVSLRGLPSCATYHYAVAGANSAGIYATSSDASFTTAGCTGDATVSTSTVRSITAAGGGSLSLGNLSLTVPRAFTATSSSAYFEAHQLAQSAFSAAAGAPTGVTLVGSDVFNLTALTDATTMLDSFTNPLTVIFTYVPSNVTNFDTNSLALYRYDAPTWTKLSSCAVNTSAHTVSCTTNSFSDVALFGTQTTPSSSSGSNPGTGNVGAMLPGYNAHNPLPWETFDPNVPAFSDSAVPARATASEPVAISAPEKPAASSPPLAQAPAPTLTRDLHEGMYGSDVQALQDFLDAEGFAVAKSGPGSLGHETTFFGPLTVSALKKYQNAHAADILAPLHLISGTGYCGPSTRAFIQSIR